MPLQIVHKDICDLVCDAIVDPTDAFYSGSGGADLAIHRAAGKRLDAECGRLPMLGCGEIAVTGAYKLPCRYVIHTVGPVWKGGHQNESALLRGCYLNALFKARELGLASLAFPLISSGTFGFPKDKVLRIAVDAISDYLLGSDKEMDVTLCIHDPHAFELSTGFALREFLEECSRPAFAMEDRCYSVSMAAPECAPRPSAARNRRVDESAAMPELSEWLRKQDDSFAVMLLKLIDKKGMSDVECYKKANVSKGTFWKINNDARYKPSKATVLAFAIALELSLDETNALLRTVGMSLSHSSLFDLIIEFYITNGCYDIYEINAALYQYDQVCLGC